MAAFYSSLYCFKDLTYKMTGVVSFNACRVSLHDPGAELEFKHALPGLLGAEQ